MSESKKRNARDEIPEVLRGKRQLEKDGKFCFGCNPDLPCFTNCCADVNIVLTPLDVLRLARRAGMKTGEFLERHTLTPITKDLHLPVTMLKMEDNDKKSCPFVGENGCTVYEDRPWSCRMYPLAMALPPARAGEPSTPYFFLFEDDFCKGSSIKKEWTVESWRTNQGVAEREKLESEYQEIVSHPWFIGGRYLDPKRLEMFHMTCFDLDRFHDFVFESSFLKRFAIPQDVVDQIKNDDTALLRFGFRWLLFALFGEPTIPVSEEAKNTTRNK